VLSKARPTPMPTTLPFKNERQKCYSELSSHVRGAKKVAYERTQSMYPYLPSSGIAAAAGLVGRAALACQNIKIRLVHDDVFTAGVRK
jgi:hypothetical protein